MFDQVYELLRDFEIKIYRDEWRRIFYTPWESSEDYVGYALFDQGNLVGFMGLLFSCRRVNKDTQKFCNITSLIVKKDFRHQTIGLILKLRELTDYTITNLTPSKSVSEMLKKIGFNVYEEYFKLFSFSPNILSFFNLKRYHVTGDFDSIQKSLSNNDLTLFKDHQLPDCKHLLIYNKNEYCYILYKIFFRKKMKLNNILYISNMEIFKQNRNWILYQLFKKSRSLVTIIDLRLVNRIPLRFGLKYPLPAPRLFWSKQLHRLEIDNLYTETVLLPPVL